MGREVHETCSTPDCGRPTPPGATLCLACTADLREALTTTRDHADALEDAVGRRLRFSEPVRSPGGDQPLPYDPAASDVAYVASHTLNAWAAELAQRCGGVAPWRSLAAAAAHLTHRVHALSGLPDAHTALDELQHVARTILVTIDAPRAQWYAGRCDAPTDFGPCPVELYPHVGPPTITCKGCGTVHDAATRKHHLLEQVDGVVLGAGAAAVALTAMGVPTTPSVIRGLRHRDKLEPVGTDARGRDLYRFGDVVQARGVTPTRGVDGTRNER